MDNQPKEGEELGASIKRMIVSRGIVGCQTKPAVHEDSKGNWLQYPPIELIAEAGKGDGMLLLSDRHDKRNVPMSWVPMSW
ncbi:hypothetical protein DSECCO2_147920 [anaerobic digester metagenome]